MQFPHMFVVFAVKLMGYESGTLWDYQIYMLNHFESIIFRLMYFFVMITMGNSIVKVSSICSHGEVCM